MDVNKHERLTQIESKGTHLLLLDISQSWKVFNNEQNVYPIV